ncbi:hypothetical protein PsAD2_01301 [Pseudovibrio axinellae]|uniref:Uncharacterized protein n=1 Tax=Pseudovibrio axinellae TaxID=989403 RepID=A0A166AB20_9HYPH|nr:hypothetical protein PsAD2_01301 [Pseudovibrio axinellae]SER21787.1 hypothetical protein SAMN05421798_10775 [Pseudovibrio axinellae]
MSAPSLNCSHRKRFGANSGRVDKMQLKARRFRWAEPKADLRYQNGYIKPMIA